MASEENLERFNIHAQLEHLYLKYPGTGTADTTKHEWITNIHRDTLASHICSPARLRYFAVAENTSMARIRHRLLNQMQNPCGPPKREREDDDGNDEFTSKRR